MGYVSRYSFSHSFKQKQMSDIMTNFGRMPLVMRRRTHLLRKMPNKFFEISDLRKNLVYSVNISAQTNDKILIFFQKIRREKL